jgi:hypothetical protein
MRKSFGVALAVCLMGISACDQSKKLEPRIAALETKVTALESKPLPRIVVDQCVLSDWLLPPAQSICDPTKNQVLVKIEGGSRQNEHKSYCCQIRIAE